MNYRTRTYGKWILAGEHAVLRGSPALVFPLTSRSLDLDFSTHPSMKLKVSFKGEHGSELEMPFWASLEKACELFDVDRDELRGALDLTSGIPVGAGLGASAALCVALVRWFTKLKGIPETEVRDRARLLENLFHGESSGVDVAVVSLEKPLAYVRGGDLSELSISWRPRLYVSYSGKRGVTRECVGRVQALARDNATLATRIDEEMKAAVQLAAAALRTDEDSGTEMLARAMVAAENCFQQWGLSEGRVRAHLDSLKKEGAIAAKPTGSGDGGYCLSLWAKAPPSQLARELIPCFNDL